MTDDRKTCALCGAVLAGPYCHECGQPGRDASRSLREVLLGQTGRLLHTLRLLFTRPGELAREIEEGRDRLSMRPLTLLLNLIAVFFLVGAPGNFTVAQLAAHDASGRAATQIEQRAAREGVPRQWMMERLDRRFQSLYSLIIPLSAGVYATAFWLLHRGRRTAWLVHIAGGVHYLCFIFVWAAVLFAIARLAHFSALRNPLAIGVTLAVNFAYLTLMLRRTYEDRWLAAMAKSAVVTVVGTIADNALFTAAFVSTMLL